MMNNNTESDFSWLPYELKLEIIGLLCPCENLIVRTVCKEWKELADYQPYWKSLLPTNSKEIKMDGNNDTDWKATYWKNSQIKLKDLDLLSVLGRGSWGKCLLVRKKDSGVLYAMETVIKKNIPPLGTFKCQHCLQHQIKSPFLPAYRTMLTKSAKFYMLFDFVSKTEDFFRYFCKSQKASIEIVRFYVAELLLLCRDIHKGGCVLSTMDVTGLLQIDLEGHITICYYASLLLGLPDTTTNDYTAPECILHGTYSVMSDWWLVGCVLYEMLTRTAPFYHNEVPVQNKMIINDPVKFPADVSGPQKDLIIHLLEKDPSKRLQTFEEIQKHEFFEGILWDKLKLKQVIPPYKPTPVEEIDIFLDPPRNEEPQVKAPEFEGWQIFTYNPNL